LESSSVFILRRMFARVFDFEGEAYPIIRPSSWTTTIRLPSMDEAKTWVIPCAVKIPGICEASRPAVMMLQVCDK
jgi:hypothetical protein